MSFRHLKIAVFALASLPFLLLVRDAFAGNLTANPIDRITDVTGWWTLRFLMITLAVTPVRRLTGWNPVIRLRRMLGLFAFFYGSLHFTTYFVLDQFFALQYIVADIAKRPFITAGFTGFVLMIPLAITSTAGWVRRLGGKRWQKLHRLVYVSAAAGVLHYFWLVKLDTTSPLWYAATLAGLLGVRILWAVRRHVPAHAGRVPAAPTPRAPRSGPA